MEVLGWLSSPGGDLNIVIIAVISRISTTRSQSPLSSSFITIINDDDSSSITIITNHNHLQRPLSGVSFTIFGLM